MSKTKILTKQIAEQFLADADSVDLSAFTSIDDDAALALALAKEILGLDGLTSLSDAAANSLAKHEGGLCLDGLTSLSVEAVAALARARIKPGAWNSITLKSLRLTVDTARELARYKGDQLVFGVSSIDLAVLKALRPFKGQLWLGEVTGLDDESAAELARRPGGAYLDGLEEYTDAPGHLALARAVVGWRKHEWVGLRGLKRVSPSALKNLAEFNGPEILASPEILKALTAVKKERVRAELKEGSLQEPREWQGDRIVPPHPPAKPLKGRGAERQDAKEASWWLPKKVWAWFVQKLDDAHKTSVSGEGYGASKSVHISPEAANLLRDKSLEWVWLLERETDAVKAQEKASVRSLAQLAVPKEFRDGKVSLPAPKKPVAEAHCWKPDFEGEDYQSVLHYYSYLPAEQVGSITDPNGYPAKAMSPEAATLYQRHRAFWEAKHAESKAQSKVAATALKKAVKQRVEKAAATAGLSRAELDAKLDRLAGLAEQGDLKLIADMVAGFEDPWLYQALLAGASVSPEGDLKPGKPLKSFKEQAEFILLLAVAFMPEGVEVDASLRRDGVMNVKVDSANADLVAEMLAPRLPGLKPGLRYRSDLSDLSELKLATAAFLARLKEYLLLPRIGKFGKEEAAALADHEGILDLSGITGHDSAVANALARHKGGLLLDGVLSLSEAAAEAFGLHVGHLTLGLKDLPEAIAARLAAHQGELTFPIVRSISPAAAAALEMHTGKLTLGDSPGSVRNFSLGAAAARHLGRHAGPLSFPNLKSLDDDAASALSSLQHGLELDGIEEFPPGPGGVGLCERVAGTPRDYVSMIHLKSLEPACAAALAKFRGKLWLNVDEWNDGALIALESHQGKLMINPKHISDEVGRALGRRGANSSLIFGCALEYYNHDVSLTDIAAEALSAYAGNLVFGGNVEMSPEAAGHLVKRRSIDGIYRSKLKSAVRKVFESAGGWTGATWTRKP